MLSSRSVMRRVSGEGSHPFIRLACPGNEETSIRPVHPFSDHQEVEALRSVGNAVWPTPTRVAAPWKCSRSTWPIGVGHCANASIILSIASSLDVAKKLDFQ